VPGLRLRVRSRRRPRRRQPPPRRLPLRPNVPNPDHDFLDIIVLLEFIFLFLIEYRLHRPPPILIHLLLITQLHRRLIYRRRRRRRLRYHLLHPHHHHRLPFQNLVLIPIHPLPTFLFRHPAPTRSSFVPRNRWFRRRRRTRRHRSARSRSA
jgi:hypothetical protein